MSKTKFFPDKLLPRFLGLRNRYFFLFDILILTITPALALILRTDGTAALERVGLALIIYTVASLILHLSVFYLMGLYGRYWRYASIDELAQIATASLMATGTMLFIFAAAHIAFVQLDLPRSLPFITGLLVLFLVGGGRFSVRLLERWRRPRSNGGSRRVLVMGAGEAGIMIVRELQKNPFLGLEAAGFLDDDTTKHGMRIHGVPVLGSHHDIPRFAAKHRVKQVIIAMPTAPGKMIREVVALCEKAGVQAKTIPGIYELLDGTVNVKQLRDVEIEDLLRREPIQTDIAAVHDLLRGKRVLITGAGGSIGSELCRQALRCGPAELIILGHGENSIFAIHNELQKIINEQQLSSKLSAPGHGPASTAHCSPSLHAVIADIRFPDRVRRIFEKHRPQIVFHAAAHKHVPLMEMNPAEAVTNNVLGTRHLLDAAQAVNVEHFVMISTDKAVNPTSVMGASKRAAELLVHQAAKTSGRAYVAVRFGNVLGSRGSVVLTFKQQIAAGGPVTVTDPDVIRYFMTIPEAVQLVLQAAVLGVGGEVFVLDMGEPIKIVDLARDLIELSGLEVGRDIDIVFTGLRPGEKLFEEMFIPGEAYHRTRHDKIFISENAGGFVPHELNRAITALEAATQCDDNTAIILGLQNLVAGFQPPVNGAPLLLKAWPRKDVREGEYTRPALGVS